MHDLPTLLSAYAAANLTRAELAAATALLSWHLRSAPGSVLVVSGRDLAFATGGPRHAAARALGSLRDKGIVTCVVSSHGSIPGVFALNGDPDTWVCEYRTMDRVPGWTPQDGPVDEEGAPVYPLPRGAVVVQ